MGSMCCVSFPFRASSISGPLERGDRAQYVQDPGTKDQGPFSQCPCWVSVAFTKAGGVPGDSGASVLALDRAARRARWDSGHRAVSLAGISASS